MNLRIVELQVSNHRKLKVVAIRPTGPVVVLSGDNGAGKSSALNAIATALKGRAVAGPAPIREGCEESRLRVDLGELVITRSFHRQEDGEITTKLSVKTADGGKPSGTPQAILDALLGNLSFDPLAFGRWDPKEQFKAVSGLVKDFDFVQHDKDQKSDFDERTDVNRRALEYTAAASKLALPPGRKPEPVVIADVLAEIDRVARHNADIETRRARRREAEDEIEKCQDEAEVLRAKAVTLERRADELQKRLDEAAALPAPLDPEPLRAKISAAESVNAVIRAHEEWARLDAEAEKAKSKGAALTGKMRDRSEAYRAAIAAAEMPIPGLDLSDGQVTLNGLPISQSGTAERIRCGLAIGAALNPRLKVILCDEGSELDQKSMKLVAEFADKKDMQVWVTRCSHDSGLPEIEIVDGEIKA